MKQLGYDEAREDGYRMKGIQLIDSVRQSLQLCVLHPPPFPTTTSQYD
jgi:CTD kinase subunit beta